MGSGPVCMRVNLLAPVIEVPSRRAALFGAATPGNSPGRGWSYLRVLCVKGCLFRAALRDVDQICPGVQLTHLEEVTR